MQGLVLKDLGRRFGNVDAVKDVNITLQPGEFLSLLGPSGCGKTTTLRMIAGFLAPTSGSILLDGVEVSSPRGSVPPEKRGMSMIFQSYAIWPNMTVLENVAFGLKLRKMDKADVRRRAGEMLEAVRLSHLADRYPSELSGGQQQRVALARALVIRPKLLLLDEPLSNLDASLREDMRFEIKRIHDEFRITSVYVTHDQSEAMVTSDRIAVINHGKVEQIDTPYEIYTRPTTRFVAGFIGRTNQITGTRRAGQVDFTGFALPLSLFTGTEPEVFISIRPQSLHLSATEPVTDDLFKLRGKISARAFLGETWDYVFRTDSGLELRIVARPHQIYQLGDDVWATASQDQIVQIH
ncbi:ABC transporter ATP-binding protein [Pararhodobacter zhoushanensis]|uniref:ABC transporter ATP-binding protein n=1 Tax=Pararhodobacter zhoushanensis TaxID=2479545 RepID=A0ABT3H5E9_9RHOB|nr:ABC transporter ATP-binding protein [Pararhodobacter zhoushanensis]MCW1934948.1 ABC transporter ATP-binding protein [Pararhodobacter zhoushanensis]